MSFLLSHFSWSRYKVFSQRWVHRVMHKSTLYRSDIIRWEWNFLETGNLGCKDGNERSSTFQETIKQARQIFRTNPFLSFRVTSFRLVLPPTAVHEISRTSFFLFPYKHQIFKHWVELLRKRVLICRKLFIHLEEYSKYLSRIVFFNEYIFRTNDVLNKQNVRVWGTEIPMVLKIIGVMNYCEE